MRRSYELSLEEIGRINQARHENATNILEVLKRGTITIKEGHRTNFNLEGEIQVRDLTYGQIMERLIQLDSLHVELGDVSNYPEHVKNVIKSRRGWKK